MLKNVLLIHLIRCYKDSNPLDYVFIVHGQLISLVGQDNKFLSVIYQGRYKGEQTTTFLSTASSHPESDWKVAGMFADEYESCER